MPSSQPFGRFGQSASTSNRGTAYSGTSDPLVPEAATSDAADSDSAIWSGWSIPHAAVRMASEPMATPAANALVMTLPLLIRPVFPSVRRANTCATAMYHTAGRDAARRTLYYAAL